MKRKIIVLSFISLDGVMQAPGGPKEDTTGDFRFGGWTYGYFDEYAGNLMNEQIEGNYDLLLGRRTYDIFAAYWPKADTKKDPIAKAFNKATKYVVSNSLSKLEWKPSVLVKGDIVAELKKLKKTEGPDLQVHGSSTLIQTLLKNDLVDELWLKIFPLTLGSGKRLFGQGTIPAAFNLKDSKTSPMGVIFADYSRTGEVKTGSVA